MEKLTMTVQELAQIMGISKPKAYELTHIQGFPAIRVGKRIVIPVESFRQWLKRVAGDLEENQSEVQP